MEAFWISFPKKTLSKQIHEIALGNPRYQEVAHISANWNKFQKPIWRRPFLKLTSNAKSHVPILNTFVWAGWWNNFLE